MARTKLLVASVVSIAISCAFGYWLGRQSASEAYGHAYVNDVVERDIREVGRDFMLLQALTENRADIALKVAQLRYYSRLMLAAETVRDSSNPALQQLVGAELAHGKKFQQEHPYEFASEAERNRWTLLVK
jgi:hypothetical protein